MKQQHYLETELYNLVQKDPLIFEFIQEGSLDGVWYWDLNKPENEWMSPKFWELFGYKPEEKKHLASQWQDMIFPEDFQQAQQNFSKHLKDQNHPYDQVVRYKHKNGKTVWVRCRGMAIRDENGKPIRMLGAHHDITNEKELEKRHFKKSNTLKAILDSSLNGIMALESVYDDKGKIIDFVWTMSNQESCKIVKIKEENLVGQKLSKMMPGNFTPLDSLKGKSLFEKYKEVVQSGNSKVLEFYFEHDNVNEWFENKIVKYEDGFVVTFSVITEQKELQLHLEKKIQEEMEKNKKIQTLIFQKSRLEEMGSMISMIAHQWRQPLNTISLVVNNILSKYKNQKLTPKSADKLKYEFKQQIYYMSKTIDDFQNFFKPTKEKTNFSINNSIIETIGLLTPLFKKHRITFSLQATEIIHLFGYETELKQVFLNLINNAKDVLIENKISNKQITIKLYKDREKIFIYCIDNGGGINKRIINNIFDPYFSTKNHKNGTGIGLYMSKVIIEEHFKGNLDVENIDQGAQFSIILNTNY